MAGLVFHALHSLVGLSCHFLSQACQPLAVPRVRCNRLKKKPSENVMPTGTGFAFS